MIRRERAGTDGRVALVTLDRPQRRNALEPAHWAALAEAVATAADEGARAIVITGAGSAFCAGADLGEITPDMATDLEASFAAVRAVPVPVLAAVNGPAVGAGAQLAVSCDLRVAGPRARFRIPAAAIGLPVHPGTIARIVALAGAGAARALLLGGDWIDARRAHTLGLVDRIGEPDSAIAWASEIARFAPLAVGYLKAQLQIDDPPGASDVFAAAVGGLLASADFAEACQARADGRPPVFQGR